VDDKAAAELYQKLFAPFESKPANTTTVYVAPDGVLNLIPFARLKLADGRFWGERQQIRLLQSGRDLLRADLDKPTRGLLVLGGIEFGATAKTIAGESAGSTVLAAAGSDRTDALNRTSATFRDFAPLPASADEAMRVKEWYQRLRKDEPAEAWTGTDASKARLMALTTPPRVLHLATHGFYLPGASPVPMLNAGVALAGANRELAGQGTGGLCTAGCGSNDECSDGEIANANDPADTRCKTGFACMWPTTVGTLQCKRLCVCRDLVGDPQGGFQKPAVCP